MSQRTIVEFNHDYAHEVGRDRGALSELLAAVMRSGRPDSEEEWRLGRYGVRVLTSRHHSDSLRVEVGGHEHYSETSCKR